MGGALRLRPLLDAAKKAVLNPENAQDRCEHCRHLAFLKREEIWRRDGRDVDVREF